MATNGTDDVWATLSDSSRRAIVLHLAERPHAVRELADALPICRPAVSQHLKVLEDAGIVALRDQLDTFWDRALSSFRDLADQPPEDER